jgi:DNA-binding PucR family transcriptional regulator
MYVFRVRSLLTDSMVFAYENGILAINHKDDRTRSDPEYAEELASQLKGMGLCCGVSLVFNDFLGLKPAFLQCKTALASRAGGLDEAIHRFEMRYAEHVIRALDDSTSLKSLCHPQVVRLHRLEGPKGPEYVRTLQTYLAHGRSATAAAARLFVHRNTLLYRIKRIEEVLAIDLESADEQMLFMLYLSCLILGRSTP